MAYSLVSNNGTQTGTTSVTPTFLTGSSANNLLIATLAYSGTGTTPAAPAGWTAATGNGTAAGGVACYYKIATGATSNPTFSVTGGTFCVALIAEFTGNATTSPADRNANADTSFSVSPAVQNTGGTDASSGELMISIAWDNLTKAGTVTSSDTFNNGATANNLANNDGTSSVNHYRFSYGFTTTNAVADQCSHADNSKNLLSLSLGVWSFKLPTVTTQNNVKILTHRSPSSVSGANTPAVFS